MPRSVDALTHEVEFRLGCVQHALASSVAEAVQVFRRAPATVYRWKKAHPTGGVRSLQPKSRRPKQTQKRQWGATSEAAILRLRQQHRRAGRAKLRVLLLAEGIDFSESTIGRILTSVKTRNLLIEPITGLRSRRVKPTRPYATRVPEDKRQPSEPGAVIQVVGGSEFMEKFEACQQRGIALYVLPPRSPKLNGRVERMNGTCRREFWEWYDGELDLPILQSALHTFEVFYNTRRLHQALGYRTPTQALAFSYVSN